MKKRKKPKKAISDPLSEIESAPTENMEPFPRAINNSSLAKDSAPTEDYEPWGIPLANKGCPPVSEEEKEAASIEKMKEEEAETWARIKALSEELDKAAIVDNLSIKMNDPGRPTTLPGDSLLPFKKVLLNLTSVRPEVVRVERFTQWVRHHFKITSVMAQKRVAKMKSEGVLVRDYLEARRNFDSWWADQVSASRNRQPRDGETKQFKTTKKKSHWG